MLAYFLPLAVHFLTLSAIQLQPTRQTTSEALALNLTSRSIWSRIFPFPMPPRTSSTRSRLQNFLSLATRSLCHAGRELHKSLDWWRNQLEFIQLADDYLCGPLTSRVLALDEALAHWEMRETGRDSTISRHPNEMVCVSSYYNN